MPRKRRWVVAQAFDIAADRLRSQPECRRLFDDLGADGLKVLARGRYDGTSFRHEKTHCRSAFAFTQVGGQVIWICESFRHLDGNLAAMILIHEALHHAGLTEKPKDPRGLDSDEINELVSSRCKL